MTVDVERFRAALLEERQRVQDAMQYIHDEHPDTSDEMNLSTHLMDSAALTTEQELDDTLEENSEKCSREIDAALERIDAGTYGTCANCGAEIPRSAWRRFRTPRCASTASGARASSDRDDAAPATRRPCRLLDRRARARLGREALARRRPLASGSGWSRSRSPRSAPTS